MFKLVSDGVEFEEAKRQIYVKYIVNSEGNQTKELCKVVTEYFGVEDIKPKSRMAEDIAPMVVLSYLIHDQIKDYKHPDVHKTFTILTGKHRTTFFHYTNIWLRNQHLTDNRLAMGDSITNHFLNIKERLTGKDLKDLRVEAETPINPRFGNQSMVSDRFRLKEKEIVHDIENNHMSYIELQDKHFRFATVENVKNFFRTEQIHYNPLIRNTQRNILSRNITEFKETFIDLINKGYTFRDINLELRIYDSPSYFKKMMAKYEPTFYNMICQNEIKRNEESKVS